MSEDSLAPIPDEPGQDPDAAEPGPYTDGYGLSGTLDSGYDLDRSAEGADGASAEGADGAAGTGGGDDSMAWEEEAGLGHT